MSVQLHVYVSKGRSLCDAIAASDSILTSAGPAVALLYHPEWCRFGRLDKDGVMRGPKDEEMSLDRVYEARIFNSAAELRWLNDPCGEHRAVLLTERDTVEGFDGPSEKLEAVDVHPLTYLLWGQGTGAVSAAGWSQLQSARIETLDVPLDERLEEGERVLLTAVEYLKEGLDGNVSVVEERLTGLEVASGQDRAGKGRVGGDEDWSQAATRHSQQEGSDPALPDQ